MQPSAYQSAIFDFVRDGTGNAIVDAVPGSGKTTTSVWAADYIPSTSSAIFLAFNKAIADTLSRKLPAHVPAKTFHSFCFKPTQAYVSARAGRQVRSAEPKKLDILADELFPRHETHLLPLRSPVMRLVSLMKGSALLPGAPAQQLHDLISHYDIECESDDFTDDDIIDYARDLLARSNDAPMFDFDDMLYLPVIANLKLPKFDFVLVDESQDTNTVQRLLLRKIMHPRSRLIAVGDPRQSIYGFRGASHDSMDRIAQDFECTTLPLSICYRCSTSVVNHAAELYPGIQAAPNAPTGSVTYPTKFAMTDFRPDDLVMCRNTAPLVQLAYKMISRRQPCKIMGRDIGRGLTSLVKKLAGRSNDLTVLSTRLNDHRDAEVSKAMARHQESKAQSVADKADSILALLDSLTPEDADQGVIGLIRVIDSLFSDNGPNVTTLCTAHRAKGLEAPRAFILDSNLMPSRYARQDWQKIQERNLMYVARTRAMLDLVYVNSDTIA